MPSALSTSQTPAVLLTNREGKPGGGKGPLLSTEESLTLATGNGQVLFEPQAFDGYNQTLSDTAQTIRADKSDGDHVGMVLEPQAFRKAARAQSSEDAESWVADGRANTLNAFDVGDTRSTHAITEQYGVRRLTPVECERLQSFPDGWTEPAGSDSARYKAMGNAVTVNVVRWILGRLP